MNEQVTNHTAALVRSTSILAWLARAFRFPSLQGVTLQAEGSK